MHLADTSDAEILSSDSTMFWKRVFPAAWTVGVGAIAALAYLDLIGSPPAPAPVKIVLVGGWAVFSALFQHWFGRLQHVWRVGDNLVIGDRDRGLRLSLTEVREVKESRMQKLKMVTLELRRATPLGRKIVFVPKGAKSIWVPWADSAVAADLRDRMDRLAPPETGRTLPG
jgi:hypothetical protein